MTTNANGATSAYEDHNSSAEYRSSSRSNVAASDPGGSEREATRIDHQLNLECGFDLMRQACGPCAPVKH